MAVPYNLARAKFGDYVADFDSFELRKHGTRLKLQDQPFQILKILVQRSGQLVTREELCAELWRDSTFVDFDAGLNAAVRRLRDALCDSAEQARYIQTVPRHGYRFIAPVEILAKSPLVPSSELVERRGNDNEAIDTGATQRTAEFSETPVVEARGIWRRAFVVACIVLLAMGLGAIVLRPDVRARHSDEGGNISIAVLPLQNLSGDPAEDFFADGMTDALITNLAQSSSVRVISSTSSMRYKNTHKGAPEIGRELNVGWILEGSVARAGNHVRVSAQLIDTATDQHLWARQYDRDLQDVLQLQGELASEVALEVTGKLTSSDRARSIISTRKVNPQAYEAYLKGEYFLNKWSQDGFEKAKRYYQQAIDLDPGYADAYVGLAGYYAVAAFMALDPPQEGWVKAEEITAKALAMDSRSAKAHTLLGMIKLLFRCDQVGAEKELDYALRLNPGEMSALDYHSYYLLEIGHTDEAIAEKRRVLEHDPLSVITNAELPLYLMRAGRTDEAIVQLQKALELDPNYPATHMRLGFAYTNKKQYDRAAVEIQKAIALDNQPMRVAKLGEVYALAGKIHNALQTITQLQMMKRYVPPTMIAMVHARLGNTATAFHWLNQAKPDDDPKITDPAFDNLRPYPQFKTLEAHLRPDPSCPAF